VDGTAREELIAESDPPKMPMSWSPDGKLLVCWTIGSGTFGDVWAVPLTGDRKPFPILQTQSNETNPQVSPDGKWIAYSSDETGRSEIYIGSFPEGPGKWQVSTDGGQFPRWRRDGKELYFIQAPTLMAAEIRVMGSSVQPGVPRTLFGLNNPNLTVPHNAYHRFAVSADGQRFLVPQPGAGPNVSGGLADNIAAVADQGGAGVIGATGGVTVVLNWPQMVKRK
jgi:dipeptidyl aminopeptidase/acylaminoacyl peptidase